MRVADQLLNARNVDAMFTESVIAAITLILDSIRYMRHRRLAERSRTLLVEAQRSGGKVAQPLLPRRRLITTVSAGDVRARTESSARPRRGSVHFDARFQNDATGASAYPPALLLKVVLFAYSQGILSSRQIERAWLEHVTFIVGVW